MTTNNDLKLNKNDSELLSKQLNLMHENYTKLIEEKQLIKVNLDIEFIQENDV